MKKQMLFLFKILLVLLTSVQSAQAYETIAVKFPLYQGWRMVDYKPVKPEPMVHYAPSGHFKDDYTEAVICKSFKSNQKTASYVQTVLNKELSKITNGDTNIKINPIEAKGNDTMQWWCATLEGEGRHCEIMRATPSHEGVMLIRYINKNEQEFFQKKAEWIERVKNSAVFYSYYRTNYVLDKDIYFEL